MDKIPECIKNIATAVGGKVNECQRLPNGSGFATRRKVETLIFEYI